jgi:hypothetical protein
MLNVSSNDRTGIISPSPFKKIVYKALKMAYPKEKYLCADL